MTVALFELALSAQLFGVLKGEADRRTDLLDDVLVRRRAVAARGFVAYCKCGLRVRLRITARERSVGVSELTAEPVELRPPAANRGRGPIEIQRRGWACHRCLVV